MESQSIECTIELIWEQYREMTAHYDKWELAFLKDEAQKDIDKLGVACRLLFGVKLDWALLSRNRSSAGAQ